MSRIRKSRWTLGQLTADGQDLIGAYTEEEITTGLWKNTFNRVIAAQRELAGGKDEEEYRERVEIPIIKRINSAAAEGSSYDATTMQLTVPLTGNVIWTNDDDGFDDSWLGAHGMITDTDSGINYQVLVVRVESATVISLQSKIPAVTIPDIAEADLVVNISTQVNNNADEINISELPNYKNIDYIEKVTTIIGGAAKECIGGPKSKVTSKNFDGMKKSHNYENQILWYLSGDTLIFSKGSLSSYGQRKIHYPTNPDPMVTEDDYADIKDGDIPLVLDATLGAISLGLAAQGKFKGQIPPDWLAAYNKVLNVKRATEEQKAVSK